MACLSYWIVLFGIEGGVVGVGGGGGFGPRIPKDLLDGGMMGFRKRKRASETRRRL